MINNTIPMVDDMISRHHCLWNLAAGIWEEGDSQKGNFDNSLVLDSSGEVKDLSRYQFDELVLGAGTRSWYLEAMPRNPSVAKSL